MQIVRGKVLDSGLSENAFSICTHKCRFSKKHTVCMAIFFINDKIFVGNGNKTLHISVYINCVDKTKTENNNFLTENFIHSIIITVICTYHWQFYPQRSHSLVPL